MSADGSVVAEQRGRWLLLLGTVLGVVLTAWGLLESGRVDGSDGDSIAVVNGQPLSRDAFDRFVLAVAQERRVATLPIEERERIRDRLVDEELLLQYGIGLGLARHEPTARRVIVQSVIASVTGAAEDVPPTEEDLRDYHATNPDRFVRPGRVAVEAVAAPVGKAGGTGAERTAADAAARALATDVARWLGEGATLETVAAQAPEVELPPVPGGPQPVETIRRYLGPTAALRAQRLDAGAVSEPFRTSAGYLVLRIVDQVEGRVPPFEEVADAVRAEWTRSQGEAALRDFVADLRAGADLQESPVEDPTATAATGGSAP